MGTLPAAPSDRPVVTRWPNTPRTVGRAREELARTLCSWELGHLEATAALVLSELVTNAVRHAKSPRGRLIETRYCRQGDGVRIEVHDANSSRPVLRPACEWDDGGRESRPGRHPDVPPMGRQQPYGHGQVGLGRRDGVTVRTPRAGVLSACSRARWAGSRPEPRGPDCPRGERTALGPPPSGRAGAALHVSVSAPGAPGPRPATVGPRAVRSSPGPDPHVRYSQRVLSPADVIEEEENAPGLGGVR
jgi:anti-sigma regulatory factor (Ser/Thr protein kinase)